MKPIFKRSRHNPILTPDDMPFRAGAVLNPGATRQGSDVVLLIRAELSSGRSDIYTARSKDGVCNWQISDEPILRHGEPEYRYEEYGCEDPRVVYIDEEKTWYITYTAYSSVGAAIAIARSTDLVTAERLCLALSPNNKDGTLFPRKVGGQWIMLHRPDAGGGIENIWIASSPDLIHWGNPHSLLPEGKGPAWDGVKVGTGPPPLLTEEGWLLLYHGVKQYAGAQVYRVGSALLDSTTPHQVLARSPYFIFQADAWYEMSGLVPNVVFPTGLLTSGDELWLYYGAADSCICLATASIQDVLSTLEAPTKQGAVWLPQNEV